MRFLLFVLLFVSPACDFDANRNADANRLEDLVDRSWQLEVFFNESGNALELRDDEAYSILFTGDGKMGGSADCNQYFGNYEAENGGRLTIDEQIGSTLALCRSESHSSGFLAALAGVERFDLDEAMLALSFGQRGRLVFGEKNASADGLFFPTQKPTEAVMEALLFGNLEVQGECLVITDQTDGARVIPVWPFGFTVEYHIDRYVVFDAQHTPLVRTGEFVQMGGGFVNTLDGIDIDSSVREGLETQCTGQIWFVGDGVIMSPPSEN